MPLTDPFFIDKSQFIADLENSSSNIDMILNPDDMLTKSNIEMLKQFYRYPAKRPFFQCLAVGASNAMDHQGAHYVVSLDFSSFNAGTWKEARGFFQDQMSALYTAYHEIVNPEKNLASYHGDHYLAVENKVANSSMLAKSLQALLKFIKESTKSKPVLLVNGVDKPGEIAGIHGYTKKMTSFLTEFYVSWAKDSAHSNYLHRALLFGRSRVMQGGLFTGLNNIGIYSLLSSNRYNDSFAFTEGDVSTLLKRHGLPATLMPDIKQMAGGYTYSARGGDMLMIPGLVASYIQSRLSQTAPLVQNEATVQATLTRAFATGAVTMNTFVRILAQREDNLARFALSNNINYDELHNEGTLLAYLAYQGLLASIPIRTTSELRSKNQVELVIPNRTAYDAIKRLIFDNESFNKERLPCPDFYPLAYLLEEQANAEMKQRIQHLKSDSSVVVLETLKSITALPSILPHDLYQPIAALLRSRDSVLRDEATKILELFNMMNHSYILAQLAAGIIPAAPNPSKPVQLRQIAMNANYKEIIRDNLAHVPRQAFFQAMLTEPGKIKCFFAPGASFKSSLISMIECCFNKGYRPEETKEAWSDETYPVLSFRFSTLGAKIQPWFTSQLRGIKRNHPGVIFDKALLAALLEGEQGGEVMAYLIDVLHQFYQKPVVVLIDSATKPFFSDSMAEHGKTKAFVTAFCSALLNNPKVNVAGLFGVNEGAHLLFDQAEEVKSYSTMHPNPFRKYFALSEGEAAALIKQAYQVDDADLNPMIDQLKNACTLFIENDVAYLHTWYACLHIQELEHATRLSDEPQHLTQRYEDFSKEACGMIKRLYQQSNHDPEVLKAFKVIFGDSAEAVFSLFADPTEEPDYRLQNVKSIVCQMISGGVLRAVPSWFDCYCILPANALFKTIFLGCFKHLLKECRQEHPEAFITNPSVLFQPVSDAVRVEQVVAVSGNEELILQTCKNTVFN